MFARSGPGHPRQTEGHVWRRGPSNVVKFYVILNGGVDPAAGIPCDAERFHSRRDSAEVGSGDAEGLSSPMRRHCLEPLFDSCA